jgi:hypothetical protein
LLELALKVLKLPVFECIAVSGKEKVELSVPAAVTEITVSGENREAMREPEGKMNQGKGRGDTMGRLASAD